VGSSVRVIVVTVALVVVTGVANGPVRTNASLAEAAAAVILDSLVIRVYDNAGVNATERAKAISRADAILSRADLDVAWIECAPRKRGRPSPVCDTPVTGAELVVRLLHASPSDDTGVSRLGLGYALIDATMGTGTIATVFIDRVTRLASDARLDRATLLGRAMAHEIGHLLLGSNEHSDAGIMRDGWTAQQVSSSRAQDWLFLPRQGERLRQARLLNGSGGATAAVRKRGASTGG
jgi:hypothetical protein